ncbi:MAG: SRPBCC family protein [Halieaceae bacterium]
MTLTTVSAEFEVMLSAADAWQRLRDLSVPDHYVQGLSSVEFTTAAQAGLGASRRVVQGKSLVLDETVTEWREGEGFTLRLHRGERGPIPPLRQHFFDYGLVEKDDRVFLHNRMRYEVGLGWLGRLLDVLLIRRVMQKQLRDVTLAQKLYYESGEPVTAAQLKSARGR